MSERFCCRARIMEKWHSFGIGEGEHETKY